MRKEQIITTTNNNQMEEKGMKQRFIQFKKKFVAPMKAVRKLLVSMELHLDASIDKLDNLAMNVQFDKEKRMEQTKDKQQKAPDTEREIIYLLHLQRVT